MTETVWVIALGQKYDAWETIEVHREYTPFIMYAVLTVAEFNVGTAGWTSLKLKPADACQVFLNGKLVLDGHVFLRQASIDPDNHAVRIGIFSTGQNVIPSTVSAEPGQYKNQTLTQIANAVFGAVGVKFALVGSPAGADKVFDRVSEHVGESRYSFIERLAKMRNIHLRDDGKGTIEGTRGPTGGVIATIVEGQSLLKAQLTLKNDEFVETWTTVGQHFNNNAASENTDVSATGTVPGPPMGRTAKMVAEEPADKKDVQMRNNHEIDWQSFQTVDGLVTVPNWTMDDGTSLWIEKIGALITLISPSLIPADNNTMTFMLKGVAHKRSNQEGTTTDLFLCRQDGLGSGTGEAFGGNPQGPF